MRHDPGPTEASALMLGEFLPYQLSVAAESVSRAFAQHYERRFKLSIPEWRVMAVLGEGSPRTTQDVIARTKMDRVKVSRATIKLVDRGLVDRNAMPDDQRAHSLSLSGRGLAMYREIVPLARRLQVDMLRAIDPEERRRLSEMLRIIEARASDLTDEAG